MVLCIILLCNHFLFKGSAAEFHCTNQGQSFVIDRVNDIQEMQVTRRAFSRLGKVDILLVALYLLEREFMSVKEKLLLRLIVYY